MDNFLDRLNRNPYQPIDSASITRVDELGNGYDDWNNLIAPKFEAPQQTWGETALSVATAPARIAAALAGSLSPYGADGWQVPPIVHEGVNALTAVGDAYNYGMTDDEINSRALGMAGFMMGGGGPAVALERSLAQRGINSTADMIPTAVKDYGQAAYRSLRYPNETAVLDSLPPGLLDRTGPQVMPSYGFGNTSGKMAPSSAEYIADSVRGDVPNNPYTVNDGWALARSETGYMNALLQSRKPEFDVIDGGLFSNASKEGAVPGIVSATQTGIGLPAFEMRAPGGKSIGRAQYDELPNAVRVKDVEIDPAFRRQGMASRLYGEIQDRTGKPMTPDTMLTPDGKAFWESSYPKAVSDYEFDGQYWRQPYTPDESVPDWRMSGGPNRPEGALWSNASKESSIPAIASALAQKGARPEPSANALSSELSGTGFYPLSGGAETGTYLAFDDIPGNAPSPKQQQVRQMAAGHQGRMRSHPGQQAPEGLSSKMGGQELDSSGTPIGSFLDRSHYPRTGLNPIHEVHNWAKVRSMARKAINGEHVPGYLYDGLNGNGNLIAGTHRAAANELLDILGYGKRIKSANINDVLDEPEAYGLSARNADRLRQAAEDGDYRLIDEIWDQSRDTSLFSNSDSRPALLASALDMSPEARLARAREMGFDLPAYHATNADFDEFRPGHRGASFFADSPDAAQSGAGGGALDWYGMRDGGTDRIMPVMLRSQRIAGLNLTPAEKSWWQSLPETTTDEAFVSGLNYPSHNITNWWQAFDETPNTDGTFTYARKPIPSKTLDDVRQSGTDVYGSKYLGTYEGEQGAARLSKEDGMDGFILRDEAGVAIGIADPRRIRSVNAAFDPSKSDSANLLAANADSRPALLASALGQEQSIPDWLLPFLPPQ